MKNKESQCQAIGKKRVRCAKPATKFHDDPPLSFCTQHWGYFSKGYPVFIDHKEERVIVTLTPYEGKHK